MRVTSPYGPRSGGFAGFHAGLDIGNARLGDAVTAIGEGTVVYASDRPQAPWNYAAPADKVSVWGPSWGGNTVVIRHAPGVWSSYAHMQRLKVVKGQRVTAGQVIGFIGDSGSAAPPPAGGGGHLHFGIRLQRFIDNGQSGWVDPWPRIQPTGELPEEENMVTKAELWAKLRDCRDRSDRRAKRIRALEARVASLNAARAALEAQAADVAELPRIVADLEAVIADLQAILAEDAQEEE
jgi:murein DD-endopeptidase MepM/ murein hydrolase activator NlpD